MLSAGAGMPIEKYAEDKVFRPLGMKNAAWERADKAGLVSAGRGLRLRAVDMAKVGMLVLNGGRWGDRQIVPEDWIKQMTAPAVVPYFGYYWWIKNILEGGSEGGAEPEYDTMGFKGQFIVALPRQNAVVVMTSLLPIEGDSGMPKTYSYSATWSPTTSFPRWTTKRTELYRRRLREN